MGTVLWEIVLVGVFIFLGQVLPLLLQEVLEAEKVPIHQLFDQDYQKEWLQWKMQGIQIDPFNMRHQRRLLHQQKKEMIL